MTNSPRQARKSKKFINRYATIAVVIVAVGFGVYVTATRPASRTARPTSATPIEKSLNRLYDEAERDLNRKDFAAAASKFRQIANIKPGYKDAERRAAAIAKELEKQKLAQKTPGPNTTDTGSGSGNGSDADTGSGSGGDANAGNDSTDSGSSGQDSTNSKGPGAPGNTGGNISDSPGSDGGALKDIPDDASPLALHLDEIDGYVSIKKAWTTKPVGASSVYVPVARGVSDEIDRVIVLIWKHDTKTEAQAAHQLDKSEYPLENEEVIVNGHAAYSGMKDESMSELFKLKQIATLSWTRDRWFFSVHVLPSFEGVPSNDYKKGVARDIAIKLGY